MKRRTACIAMAAIVLTCVSCGGGGSGPSTASSPSPITRGLLIISQTGDGLYGMMPDGMWRLKLPIEVKAMNDIALTLNYARLTLFDRAGTEIKRVEVGTSEIVAQAGSNHVTKDRTLAFTIVFKYTPQPADSYTMMLSATDANGNVLDASLLTNSRWRPDPEL